MLVVFMFVEIRHATFYFVFKVFTCVEEAYMHEYTHMYLPFHWFTSHIPAMPGLAWIRSWELSCGWQRLSYLSYHCASQDLHQQMLVRRKNWGLNLHIPMVEKKET